MNTQPAHEARRDFLLRNGLIVDGTGSTPFPGNVLVKEGRIAAVSEREITFEGAVIDCGGRAVAPGFIDMHSHNDWFMPSSDQTVFTAPFTSQGITTFVGGNCGYSAAGFKDVDRYRNELENNIFKAGHGGIRWKSFAEYFGFLKSRGISHNLAMLTGHGTTRASIRGFDSSDMKESEISDLSYQLEKAMDEGARGVSFGLGYEPGVFTPTEELEMVAKLVRKKDKIITVHMRAFSKISGAYPMNPFGEDHNVMAVREFIELARRTGVRLQISHLIFVGARTWKNHERVLEIIDRAIDDGIDVRFDTYAYHCGASVLTGFMPPWFMAGLWENLKNRSMLRRLRIEMFLAFKLVGFDYRDIQITWANHDELNRFNGMFLYDIARERKLSDFENFIDFIEKSAAAARVLMYRYSNDRIIEDLIRHRASLFMTDAWIETGGVQNPAAFGCFPRILQISRERRLLTLEEAVRKMTGDSARRFNIKDRGLLKPGMAADITVFDQDAISDNTTVKHTGACCTGITAVYINGLPAYNENGAVTAHRPGAVLS